MTEKMIRPLWPYGKWIDERGSDYPETSKMRIYDTLNTARTLAEGRVQKHATLACGENSRLNGLQTFVRVFNTDLEVYDTEIGHTVEKEINNIMEGAVAKLINKERMFKSCRLIKTGSVVEGTKVGKMDEFDYLFVWDLDDIKEVFTTCVRAIFNKKKLSVDGLDDSPDAGSGLRKTIVYDVIEAMRKYYLRTFLQEVQESIVAYDDWKILNMEDVMSDKHAYIQSSIASTLHMRSDKHSIDIDIDICMCIPFAECDIKDNIYDEIYFWINSQPSITAIKSLVHSRQDLESFVIINNSSILSGKKRVAIPKLEMSLFLEYGRLSGQVKTYRYVKCIARRFFPKVSKDYGCPRCSDCLVKTYYLKNIIFYMMNNHADPSLWSDYNVSNRVIEVFDILAECIQRIGASNSKTAELSTFYIPELLRFECLYNYDRSKLTIVNENKLFDSYGNKDISFCLEYTNILQTGNAAIDEMVKSYFEYVQNERWDSLELILKVRDLLHKLKELSL